MTLNKIFNKDKLLETLKKIRDEGKTVVLAHGHFNVIHPDTYVF